MCEEITQSCNPRDVVPDNLLDCSGINGDKNTLFFNDPDLAALGREICDHRERNSNSPARRGFAPSLSLPGTLCQGQDGLYVVVCVPQKEEVVKIEGQRERKIDRKMVWSPCNLMEIAAYETQKNIRQRIRARKRQLLHVAKEMLKLQSRMYAPSCHNGSTQGSSMCYAFGRERGSYRRTGFETYESECTAEGMSRRDSKYSRKIE